MTMGIAFPLLGENFSGLTNGLSLAGGGGLGTVFPSNAVDFGDFGDEVTFIASLTGVTGAPTAWSVGLKLQVLVPHTTNFIHQQRRWVDLSSYNLAGMVVEGVGFGTAAHPGPVDGAFGLIADQTDNPSVAAPITAIRTIRHFGKGVRVALNLAATGGTDPRVKLSLNAFVRGVN